LSSPNRLPSLVSTIAICFFGVGCVNFPSNDERTASFAPYASARIGGQSAQNFLFNRYAGLLSGDKLAISVGGKGGSHGLEIIYTGPLSGGSATPIDRRGYFLTAAHCIGHQPIYLWNLDKDGKIQFARARVVWLGDEDSVDLAILQVLLPVARVFKWATEFKPGDPVLGAGPDYDLSKFTGFSTDSFAGSIVKLSPLNGATPPTEIIFHSVPNHPGDSGGPLVTAAGRLVGIFVGWDGAFDLNGVAVHVPLAALRAKGLRPDLDWLRRTIEADAAAHGT